MFQVTNEIFPNPPSPRVLNYCFLSKETGLIIVVWVAEVSDCVQAMISFVMGEGAIDGKRDRKGDKAIRYSGQ